MLTCEHASNRLPAPYVAEPADRPFLDDHWGWDIGAADLVRALRASTDSVAVLSDYSRLIVDPNRPEEAQDLVRRVTEGHALSFNRDVDAAETERRVERFFRPYHAALRAVLDLRVGRETLLAAVHSFTPVYEGERRWMELGVLFDEHDDLAAEVARLLRQDGWQVALNEPYSGKAGLAYAVHRHGKAHAVPYLEFEVRNDLIRDPAGVARVARSLDFALRQVGGV